MGLEEWGLEGELSISGSSSDDDEGDNIENRPSLISWGKSGRDDGDRPEFLVCARERDSDGTAMARTSLWILVLSVGVEVMEMMATHLSSSFARKSVTARMTGLQTLIVLVGGDDSGDNGDQPGFLICARKGNSVKSVLF